MPRALVALHVAVALFGFAGLFGKLARSVAGRDRARPHGDRRAARSASCAAQRGRDARRSTCASSRNGVVLALHWVSFFAAIQVSTVAIGLLGYASFPLFALILERVLLGAALDRREGAHGAAA